MNILVFGKDGQLGRAFQEQLQHPFFKRGNTIRFVGRNECDLMEASQITDLLNAFRPQLLINTAAYTAVDKAETESDLAFVINATAPELMAKYAVQYGATLIHFSSDYVFDGSKDGAYSELDQTNPLGVYGKSKEAGERAIVKIFAATANQNAQFVILRTSWIYGDGENFIRTILRLAREYPVLKVVDDQYGAPTSADWLAEVACNLALNDGKLREFTSGIYHAAPRGETNWHGLACLAVREACNAGWQLQASPREIAPIPASAYPLLAPRPMNSRLSTNKLHNELERLGLVSKLPHWKTPWDEQVSAYVKYFSVN
jgi:dTDP-4-dehydrorhamnose reductase